MKIIIKQPKPVFIKIKNRKNILKNRAQEKIEIEKLIKGLLQKSPNYKNNKKIKKEIKQLKKEHLFCSECGRPEIYFKNHFQEHLQLVDGQAVKYKKLRSNFQKVADLLLYDLLIKKGEE